MYLVCPGLIYYEWVYKGGWGWPYRYEQKKHPDQKMSCSSGAIDTQECLEPPLTALASFEDQQHNVCVSGHNIKSIDSQSPETCAQACLNHGDSCLGIEYRYTDGRCTLANGDNTAGCNGSYYKIDWYKRRSSATTSIPALASFEDQQHNVCVSGHNIKSIDSQSPETCAQACLNHGDSCLGIEYRYTDGRCTLANGDNTAGCNGSYYKIDWYKRTTGREDASLLELGDERAFVKTE